MMPLRARIPALVIALSALAGMAWAEESNLVTVGGITIRADMATACDTGMKLSATAANVDAFRSADMTAALDGARVALGFKCPDVAQVMLVGYVGEELVYGAVTSVNGNWAIIEIPAQFAASAGQAVPIPAPAPEAMAAAPAAEPTAPPLANPLPAAPTPATGTASSLANLSLPPAPETQQAVPAAAAVPPTLGTATTSASSIEEFAPVQQASTQGRFPYADYNFAVLMAAIHAGDTDRIPATNCLQLSVGNIMMRQRPSCSGTYLGEAIRCLIQIAAL